MHPLEFTKRLRTLPGALASESYKEPLGEVVDQVGMEVRDNFRRQTDRNGTPWPPRKGNPPHAPLIKTGTMLGAATVRGASGNITDISDRDAATGIALSAVPYAAVHQYGGIKVPVPKREFFYLSDDAVENAAVPIQSHARALIIKTMTG